MTMPQSPRDIISKKEIAGYIFIGLWVLLLATTNFLSWAPNYLRIPDITPSPVMNAVMTLILLGPITIVAFLLSNSPAQRESKGILHDKPKAQIALNTVTIVIGAYIGYALILEYLH